VQPPAWVRNVCISPCSPASRVVRHPVGQPRFRRLDRRCVAVTAESRANGKLSRRECNFGVADKSEVTLRVTRKVIARNDYKERLDKLRLRAYCPASF
jgi:hypothetical protein